LNFKSAFVLFLVFLFQITGIREFNIELYSQPSAFFNDKTVLFNKTSFNPSYLTDSNFFVIDYYHHRGWSNSKVFNNEIFLKLETGMLPMNLSMGVIIDYYTNSIVDERSILWAVKKEVLLGSDSKFNFGFNVGMQKTSWDFSELVIVGDEPLLPMLAPEPEKFPLFDLGVAYKYQSSSFGLSYKNIPYLRPLYNIFPFYPYYSQIVRKGFIIDYEVCFPIAHHIKILPELNALLNKDQSILIIGAKIDYKGKLSSGFLYNSTGSYGFLLSGTIKNRYKLGYFYDYNHLKMYNSYAISTHGVNLGIVLF